jgi:pimeloyl-ACP methyl ester carboxylesterase
MKNFDHHSGKHLEINGAKIYFEVTGNESSPALLFLHGGFGNIDDFNSILSNLNNDAF